MIQFRKQHLGRYLVALVTRPYDDKMINYLDMVGKMHTPKAGSAELDVPLVQMNALLGFVADALTNASSAWAWTAPTEVRTLRAFNKLLWIQNDLITRHYQDVKARDCCSPDRAASALMRTCHVDDMSHWRFLLVLRPGLDRGALPWPAARSSTRSRFATASRSRTIASPSCSTESTSGDKVARARRRTSAICGRCWRRWTCPFRRKCSSSRRPACSGTGSRPGRRGRSTSTTTCTSASARTATCWRFPPSIHSSAPCSTRSIRSRPSRPRSSGRPTTA